jgi:uncharacterized membrane protein
MVMKSMVMNMSPWQRWLRNLTATPFLARRHFPPTVLQAIEAAVTHAEARHAGEIRFVVEAALDIPALLAGQTPRERALEVFSALRVWDTAHNNGVLIYLLLAEHDVEIIVDRGLAARVSTEEWERVCHEMEAEFRAGRFREGAVTGIEGVASLLGRFFPHEGGDRNEQPNRPILL